MTNSPAFWIGYIVLIFAFMYFIAIRPQQKEKKKMQELMASIAVGDSVLTSSGFYGVKLHYEFFGSDDAPLNIK